MRPFRAEELVGDGDDQRVRRGERRRRAEPLRDLALVALRPRTHSAMKAAAVDRLMPA